MAGRTHYDTLGLEPTASADEVRRAWKTLIQVWHPDRFTGTLRAQAEEMTKALNQAYAILIDDASRAAYEASMNAPGPQPRAERTHEPEERREHEVEIIDLPRSADLVINVIAITVGMVMAVVVLSLVFFAGFGLALELGANPIAGAVLVSATLWTAVLVAWRVYRRRARGQSI